MRLLVNSQLWNFLELLEKQSADKSRNGGVGKTGKIIPKRSRRLMWRSKIASGEFKYKQLLALQFHYGWAKEGGENINDVFGDLINKRGY